MTLQSLRPSSSMAVSLLALVIALGTAGYAANTVGSNDIIDESIQSIDIKDGEVKTSDLADLAITHSKVAVNAVSSPNVSPNSLTAADIKGADVSGTISLAAGAVALGRCRDFNGSVSGAQVGEIPIIAVKGSVAPGLLIHAVKVSAANQVLLKICNLTGGSNPALSNIPVRVMTFG